MTDRQFQPMPPAQFTFGRAIPAVLLASLALWSGVRSQLTRADAADAAKPPANDPRIVGYFAEWADGRGYHVADDPQSLRLKAEYARDHKLGGVMIWELSEDDERSSLLNALNEGLRPARDSVERQDANTPR